MLARAAQVAEEGSLGVLYEYTMICTAILLHTVLGLKRVHDLNMAFVNGAGVSMEGCLAQQIAIGFRRDQTT